MKEIEEKQAREGSIINLATANQEIKKDEYIVSRVKEKERKIVFDAKYEVLFLSQSRNLFILS